MLKNLSVSRAPEQPSGFFDLLPPGAGGRLIPSCLSTDKLKNIQVMIMKQKVNRTSKNASFEGSGMGL